MLRPLNSPLNSLILILCSKECYGARAEVSLTGGLVWGVNGVDCNVDTYNGWFLEGGTIGIGPTVSGATNWNVNQVTGGLGIGGGAALCKYECDEMP